MSPIETRLSFFKFLWQIKAINEKAYKALQALSLSNEPPLEIVLEQNCLPTPLVKDLYQKWQQVPFYSLDNIAGEVATCIPEPLVRRYNIIAFDETEFELSVATANPFDIEAQQHLSVHFFKPIKYYLADIDHIQQEVEKYYRHTQRIHKLAYQAQTQTRQHLLYRVKEKQLLNERESSCIAELVDTMLSDAVHLGSSDIHIEADTQRIVVFYRLSGALTEQLVLSAHLKEVLLRHILARSDGDITELRLPQDTSFQFKHNRQLLNVRVSILYGLESYSIVLRLLMPAEAYTNLQGLVQSAETLAQLQQFLASSNGMLIITGPTSSGKTTLLYNIISQLKQNAQKIITTEDPIEVQLPGVTQVQANPAINLTYAEVIRASLRQNPDTLMIGEIRDSDSANMALRAAMTGIMVLTTLHTQHTASAVLRLLDLGAQLPMIASGLKLVIACRLVRILCTHCKQAYQLKQEEIEKVLHFFPQLHQTSLLDKTFYKTKGCDDCYQTGYRGLKGIYEHLLITETLSDILLNEKNTSKFNQMASEQVAGRQLSDAVLQLWQSGVTSYEEVIKVRFSS